MKPTVRILIVLLLSTLGSSLWAQYGMGTNNPNPSAALEIVSPDKGVLIPRLTLTANNTLAPVTGAASTTHNGMVVYNDNPNSVNGLTGVGFYVWQGGATGQWTRLATTDDAIVAGTTTNTTLRWDGTAWVESSTILQSATGTATLAANTTVTGTLEVTDTATLSSDLVVAGNSTASGTLTVNSTTTLNAALVDSLGETGTANQILTSTGTSTIWMDNDALAAGTVTNTTLRWDGTAWVESSTILQSATGTATVAANTTVTGTLELTETATLSSDLTVAGNTTTSGTLTANSTVTLNAAVEDVDGNTGNAGQILSSTGTSTRWVAANATEIEIFTADATPAVSTGIVIINPTADTTITLDDIANYPVGFTLKIRRNTDYTGTNDHITLTPTNATIDGQVNKSLNLGYQSLTVVNIGTEWVSIY